MRVLSKVRDGEVRWDKCPFHWQFAGNQYGWQRALERLRAPPAQGLSVKIASCSMSTGSRPRSQPIKMVGGDSFDPSIVDQTLAPVDLFAFVRGSVDRGGRET